MTGRPHLAMRSYEDMVGFIDTKFADAIHGVHYYPAPEGQIKFMACYDGCVVKGVVEGQVVP